jgi:hypothetical protein
LLLCTYIAYLVTLILYKHNIMPRGQGSDCACSTAYRRGSRSCVSQFRNCISFVPRCLLQVYQLRPESSSPSMTSCAPRLVRSSTSCVPTCLLHAYLSCPDSSTARMCCIERYGYTTCPTILRFLLSFIILYFIHNHMHTYIIVEGYRQCTVVRSCYCL